MITHTAQSCSAKWYLCHSAHQWVRASVRTCSPELSTIWAPQMTSCVAPKKCHTCVITCRVWCKNLPVPVLMSMSENEHEYILSWVEFYLGPSDGSMHPTQKVSHMCDNMQSSVQKATCATSHKYEWEWVCVHAPLNGKLLLDINWQYALHLINFSSVW